MDWASFWPIFHELINFTFLTAPSFFPQLEDDRELQKITEVTKSVVKVTKP
jgi:hypothetical protein